MRCLTLPSVHTVRHTVRRRLRSCDSTHESRRTKLSRSIMAPKSLLRHVFRDIQPKIDHLRSPNKRDSPPERPTAANSEPNMTSSIAARTPLAHSAPYIPGPAIPDDIAEESSADTGTQVCEPYNDDDLASLGFTAFTTRHLLDTTVFEAKLALQSHIDSLALTLALLEALDGFSQTITILKKDMMRAERECRKKMRLMEDIEAAVEAKDFDGDTETIGGGGGRT